MKNTMSAKSFGLSLLFWVTAFSIPIFLSPFAVNAQKSSTSMNLEGTKWEAEPFTRTNSDGSESTLEFLYTFEKQGKVRLLVSGNRGAGIVATSPYGGSITTSPAHKTWTLIGTYRVSGRVVYLDFPEFTIRAAFPGSPGKAALVMKGSLTRKDTNKVEQFLAYREDMGEIIVREMSDQNKSSGGLAGDARTTTLAPTNELECLPKQGTLIIKMKGGSKKIIDLSEAATITVVL